LRKIKAIALIVVILFGSFFVSRVNDPEEIVPVLPPWGIEAGSDPPIGSMPWPSGNPVLGVEIGTESRAYLLSLLEWHGVLNDRMSGQQIAVTYSVLSDSAAVYDRVMNDTVLTFEVHLGVYRNGLVLRDEQTGSLWSQMDGRALMGPLQGRVLTRIGAVRTTWSNWEALHPTTRVLLPPGERDYGIHLYGDYSSTDDILFPYRYEDASLGAKDPVLGVDLDGHFVAFPLATLSGEKVVMHNVDSDTIVVTYAYGAAVAYDADNMSFSFVSDSTMKDQNEERWNMTTGERESDGHRLLPLQANATVCYWFAWLNMHPETSVYGIESREVLDSSWIVASLPWTVGLLLCLLVVLLDRHQEQTRRDPSRPLRWIVFKRSLLLSALALIASSVLLLDAPRNLQIGNVALQILFASMLLLLGVAMAFEWFHLKGYEGAAIPIDMGEFRDNLQRAFAIQDVAHEELRAKKLGFVDTEGGFALSDPDAELLFHERWLLVGNSEGLAARDAANTRRLVDMSMTMPEDEELA
jgi:hypothetical protein